MPEWRVPFVDLEFGEDEIASVVDTYRSGWLSMGPRTEELEQRFARYTGSKHAIAVANGTAALHLVCSALNLGPGDEVIMPSLTFVATASAVRHTGATPSFADIAGLDRPWLSAEAASAAITERTRGIINMTYGGHPGESRELAALASERDLILLEDAAHGLGGRLDGDHLGTLGAAGAFSFFPNKNLPVGEGGMVVTDDDGLASRVRLLRSHGMTSLSWDRHRGLAQTYDVVEVGFNYRIDEPRAALATARLERLDADNELRAAAAADYRQRLDRLSGTVAAMPPAPGATSAHNLFTVVLDPELDRDRARDHLADRGIQTSLHYPPVHRLSAYRQEADVPLTDQYAERAISLPLFPGITADQIGLVVECLSEAVE